MLSRSSSRVENKFEKASYRTTPLRILVVDDSAGDVALAKIGFTQVDPGCSITAVSDGQQAIQFLRQIAERHRSAFDLVLLDLNLPRFNGFQVLAVIRYELALTMPVVMFSTSTDPKDHQMALYLGADDFVTKPSSADNVFDMFRPLFRRYVPSASRHPSPANLVRQR